MTGFGILMRVQREQSNREGNGVSPVLGGECVWPGARQQKESERERGEIKGWITDGCYCGSLIWAEASRAL